MWCAVRRGRASAPLLLAGHPCGRGVHLRSRREKLGIPYSPRRVPDGYLLLPSSLCPSDKRRSTSSMACSFSPSSATRLKAVDAAAVKNVRVPLKASVAPAQRSPGTCKATARQEGATQDSSVSVSSARTQLDLLEQLTSPTSDGIGLENGSAPAKTRQCATIREQLLVLANGKVDEFTLPLGKKLKEGLKSLNNLTVSQRRNIKRQALLTKVSGRNDSVFFATVGAFVLVPPFAILAIAVLTGYIQLLP